MNNNHYCFLVGNFTGAGGLSFLLAQYEAGIMFLILATITELYMNHRKVKNV